MLLVAARLARPPFLVQPAATEVFAGFLAHGTDGMVDSLLAAPDTSFRRLEATFRRTNDAWSAERGLVTLMKSDGELLVQGFR